MPAKSSKIAHKQRSKAFSQKFNARESEELSEIASESEPELEPQEVSESDENSDEEELRAYLSSTATPDVVRKVFLNKTEALKSKLADISIQTAWIDTQVSTVPLPPCDIDNDLDRELAIYQQAMASVNESLAKLEELGVKTERPEDYFAEMVKTDEHMLRIRKSLLEEKKGMEASLGAKKQRLLKKFGKSVQVEKLQQRQMEKSKNLDKIKDMKLNQNVDFDGEFEKEQPVNFKRDSKNQRYGFGGSKRGNKTNTRDSTHDDMDGFSMKRMKAGASRGISRGGRGGSRGGGSSRGGRGGSAGGRSGGGVGKKARPGKSNRPRH